MAKKAKVILPVAPLADLMGWWQSQQIQGVLIGGLAVSLLARPRVTRDVDVLVLLPENRWPAFLDAGKSFGFVPRIDDALAFALENRVLLVRHGPTGVDIDISLGFLPFEEETVARSASVEVAGVQVPLPTPEDLVIMKAIAHRAQDMLDIDAVLVAYPSLDIRRIRRWVKAFADTLDVPELIDDLERSLANRPRRKRGKH